MALSIRNERAEQLAREITLLTGNNMTQTIIDALEEKLERLKGFRKPANELEEIMALAEQCSALPDLDTRTADEMLGYDENGTHLPW